MRDSQYLRPYLETTADPATRYTPGTFLAYTLRGKAAKYSDVYLRALLRSLEREERAGKAMRVPSVRKGVAWIQISPAQEVR
jgi:hypothetical protein